MREIGISLQEHDICLILVVLVLSIVIGGVVVVQAQAMQVVTHGQDIRSRLHRVEVIWWRTGITFHYGGLIEDVPANDPVEDLALVELLLLAADVPLLDLLGSAV